MNNIEDLIQRRRLQLLIHSCIYYHLNQNIISDKQWDAWAKELVDLQKQYPEESKRVIWYEAFKDWDASTGAFLPITDEWVIQKSKYLIHIFRNYNPKKEPIKSIKKLGRKKLF